MRRYAWILMGLLSSGLWGERPREDPAALARPAQKQFTDRDGLPQNSANALAFDAQGRLWIGTENGAAFWNGVGFSSLHMPNHKASDWVTTLSTTQDGALWFGTRGGGIHRLREGVWKSYGPKEGLGSPAINALREVLEKGGGHRLYAGLEPGLARLEGEHWLPVPLPPGLEKQPVRALQTDAEGNLWVGTLGGLAILQQDHWRPFLKGEGPGTEPVYSLLASEGRVWVGTSGRIHRLEQETWTHWTSREGVPEGNVTALAETRGPEGTSTLWAGFHGNGVIHFRDGVWVPLGKTRNLAGKLVVSLLPVTGTEGTTSLWIGTRGNGLVRLDPGAWSTLDESAGLKGKIVFGFAESATDTYVVTADEGLNRIGAAGGIEPVPLPSGSAITLHASNGDLWIGTTQGIVYRLKGKVFQTFGPQEGLPTFPVRDLKSVPGEKGLPPTLWAASFGGGLLRWEGGRWLHMGKSDGIPDDQIKRLCVSRWSPSPRLYVGTPTGLFLVERANRAWVPRPGPKVLQGIAINHMVETTEQGRPFLWVATSYQGLFRIDPENPQAPVLHFHEASDPALPSDTINRIEQDRQGRIYATTHRGVARLSPQTQNPAKTTDFRLYAYTTGDGLPSLECNGGGASMVDSRGRIWIGTIAGAAILDPAREVQPKAAPALVLDRIQVEGKSLLSPKDALNFHHRENHITFDYTLLSAYREEDTLYQTHLLGLEKGAEPWSSARREDYHALPPGKYIFRVQGRDYAGNLTPPLDVPFRILPPPWATWWAYAIYVLIFGALIPLTVLVRMRLLHARNTLLEAKVHERTAQLEDSEQRAREASLAKSAFLAGMSHELRTPLNAILGYSQLMVRDPGRSPKDRLHLDMVLRAGEHLLGLINDVLSVSRIEARQLTLNLQPFDTRRLFQGIEEMIRLRAQSKGLSFDVEIDPKLPLALEGDEGKLRQVLLNLLGNAVKFTEEGGVGLRVNWVGGGQAHFEVVDTGPGIAPEELPNLFGSFQQTESGRRATEGAGLGLYLSQSMVRLMGGEIRVTSEVGRGTRFQFEISLKPGEVVAAQVRRVIKLAEGEPVLRQLVVDDKADNRELLVELLGSVGFEVQSASNGVETVDLWQSWHPDVIWMDMRMPGMSGYDATRAIRTLESERGLPRTTILALTASVFDHDREAVLAAGCDDMLAKPYRERDLFDMLAAYRGIRFLEEGGEAPQSAPVPPLEEGIRALPEAWRQTFRQALTVGDTDEALRLLAELPSEQAPVATRLAAYLDEFRLDELNRVFEA